MRVNICAGQAAAFRAKLALSRARASGSGLASSVSWWRNAVMYEVYLRSFADGDGDGIGDIPGLRSRLPYLRDLGVDGILISPWYPSPMKDGGYDVSNYVGIEPLFGTLADARELINDAHRNDLKVVVDFVANHTSDQRLARYMRPGELHTTFNLDFLKSPLNPGQLRQVIDNTTVAFGQVGAPAAWVLSSHDETRHVTRYRRAFTGAPVPPAYPFPPSDRALGARRARAMLLLLLALPGLVFLYQGEELGLWEIENLPDGDIHDPVWESSGHSIRGRDGCRIPLPWSGTQPPFGFTTLDRKPWLPQPPEWSEFTAEAEIGREDSMLNLYRAALHIRRTCITAHDAPLAWIQATSNVLAFDRGTHLRCTINLSAQPCPLSGPVLIASQSIPPGQLPADAAAWTN